MSHLQPSPRHHTAGGTSSIRITTSLQQHPDLPLNNWPGKRVPFSATAVCGTCMHRAAHLMLRLFLNGLLLLTVHYLFMAPTHTFVHAAKKKKKKSSRRICTLAERGKNTHIHAALDGADLFIYLFICREPCDHIYGAGAV